MRRLQVRDAVKRLGLGAAIVAIGLVSALIPTTSARAAEINPYVGFYCWNNSSLSNTRSNGACVWMNVDYTNDRITAYAEGHGILEPAEANSRWISNVELRYLRLQRQAADRTWHDVAGTTVNDIDGWQPIDKINGVAWACRSGAAVLRAVVQLNIREQGRIATTMVRSGSYTSYGYGC